MSPKTCHIIGAAPAALPPICPAEGELIVAADGGLAAARAAGIRPHLCVGDMDSLSCEPGELPIIRHPVRKDETDTALALREGARRGCERFYLYGCSGGRPDHTLAAYQAMAEQTALGAECWLFGDGFAVTPLLPGRLCFPAGLSGTVSVFPFGGACRGVCERGLSYALEHADLSAFDHIGVSNAFTGEAAEISLSEGCLLVMAEVSGGAPAELAAAVERKAL